MALRSIASLSISFGLVSIPVKLYSATENAAAIRFKLMSSTGARVRQQYMADVPAPTREQAPEMDLPETEEPVAAQLQGGAVSEVADDRPALQEQWVVERPTMLKGYEYERGKFVLFTPQELKALAAGSRQTIDIVSFIPEKAVDPIFYDKAYFLAPDKHGTKPYNLLLRAMLDTGRCALAKWAFRSKAYVVQIRAAGEGIVLQQLRYAEEVRSFADLHLETVEVGEAELKLAKQLIVQISAESYDPGQFVDEEKQRVLAAVAEKIAGKEIAVPSHSASARGKVIDLLGALRASLQAKQDGAEGSSAAVPTPVRRKQAKRVPSKARHAKTTETPPRSRSRKH